jgi:nucleoside-diphosphate-sugar epimerase
MAQDDVVVVLGGGGFIGQHLSQMLLGKVRELRIVGRKIWGADETGVRYLQGDVSNAIQMMQIIKGATTVYQLTREVHWMEGAKNVAEACLQHQVRRLIFASTSDALFLGRSGIIYETDPTDPRPDLRNDYSRGKGESEKLLLDYMAKHGIGVVIMRPCLVVGRGSRLNHGGIGRWTSPTTLSGWGNGTNKMPFVLVQDVADAMVRALDAPGIEGKAFNLAGDVFISACDYARIAAERTRRNIRFVPRNLFVLALQSAIKGRLKQFITGHKTDYQTYHDLVSSSMTTMIDNSQSKKLLGWKPNNSLELFVREAIDSQVESIHSGDYRLSEPPPNHRMESQ